VYLSLVAGTESSLVVAVPAASAGATDKAKANIPAILENRKKFPATALSLC